MFAQTCFFQPCLHRHASSSHSHLQAKASGIIYTALNQTHSANLTATKGSAEPNPPQCQSAARKAKGSAWPSCVCTDMLIRIFKQRLRTLILYIYTALNQTHSANLTATKGSALRFWVEKCQRFNDVQPLRLQKEEAVRCCHDNFLLRKCVRRRRRRQCEPMWEFWQ